MRAHDRMNWNITKIIINAAIVISTKPAAAITAQIKYLTILSLLHMFPEVYISPFQCTKGP